MGKSIELSSFSAEWEKENSSKMNEKTVDKGKAGCYTKIVQN
jgi:hypothetical protein